MNWFYQQVLGVQHGPDNASSETHEWAKLGDFITMHASYLNYFLLIATTQLNSLELMVFMQLNIVFNIFIVYY